MGGRKEGLMDGWMNLSSPTILTNVWHYDLTTKYD